MAPSTLPSTMKAWQYTTKIPQSLTLNSAAPTPTLPRGNSKVVIVRVEACSLNPIDYKLANMISSLPVLGAYAIYKPATPVLDFAGTIVEGPNKGSAVVGRITNALKYGALTEYLLVVSEADYTIVKPAMLNKARYSDKVAAESPSLITMEQGASIGTAALTSYQAIVPNLQKIMPNDHSKARVFINGGSGGCGTWALQIAGKALGCHVVTTCSTRNVDLCRSLGASEVIDYSKEDVITRLSEIGSTEKNKFDLVIDLVGDLGPLYFNMHKYSQKHAIYVQIGAQMSLATGTSLAKKLFTPSVLGGGQHQLHILGAKSVNADFEQIIQWMHEQKIKAIIEKVYEFDNQEGNGPVAAFEHLMGGRTRGKVVIRNLQK